MVRKFSRKRFPIAEFHVAGIILVLGFLLGIQVVKISQEFIKAVHGREMFIAVTLVVFAELSCRVAEALQNGSHRDVRFLPTFLGTRHTNLSHARAYGNASADEGGSASGATLLAVVVREGDSLGSDAINVGVL